MRIGIIGAGNIGSTLARRLTALGHRVVIANSRGPETLTQLAADTGAVAGTAHEAARDQDLLVITIPERAIPNLPGDLLAGAPEDLVVIDTGPLAESWRQQPNTPVYGQDLDAEGARGALAAAVPLRGPAAG